MVNDSKTCQEPFRDGLMERTGERKFNNEYGAEDWGD
jgi:hypothetical protein